MAKKGDVTYEIRADDSNLENDLDQANSKVEKKVSGGAEKLKSVAGGTAKAIGAGMATAGAAAVAVGTMAVNSAVSMDQAMNQFISSTGKGTEEAERYQGILENIYKNNYGDSFEDIAGAMATIDKNMGDMDDAALQQLTESAFALRDTFEYDIAESTRAAKAMMDNFGVSGEEAMNLIATGAQNGLDYSGELLDSISEYSVHFGRVGLDADDMFAIMQKGAESGAFNLDKVGDAVKEMSIRVLDGSDTTKAGFESIGLDADTMAEKFAAGGDSAKEAFQQTIDALAAMEDPLAQNEAGVALFGTMWEDLGADAVTALADVDSSLYETSDAMNQIKEVKYDDLGSMFEGLKRSVEMLLLPLGEKLIPVLSDVMESIMPIVEEALPPFIEITEELLEQLMPVVEEIFPILLDLLSELLPPLMEIIEAVLPILVELIQQLLPPIIEIISTLLPPLLELLNVLLPIVQMLIDALMPLVSVFMNLLTPIVSLISQALVPLIAALTPIIGVVLDLLVPALQVLMSVFEGVFAGIVGNITDKISIMTDLFNGIISFIKNVFTGNWKGAWESIKNIFGTIADGIGNVFKAPINFIIDALNTFIKGINKIKIPKWVPSVGGKGINIPTIPRLKIGMDYVPSDMFPAFLDKGEWVLTKEEADLLRSLGGLEGMTDKLSHTEQNEVNVTVQSEQIDYDQLGDSVYNALSKHGMSIRIGQREFGRIIEETMDERR